jgi:hypothetical protein
MWWFKEKVGICEWEEIVCFGSKFTLRKKGEKIKSRLMNDLWSMTNYSIYGLVIINNYLGTYNWAHSSLGLHFQE